MSDYWVMDENGGVLGPVGIVVLGDLARAGLVCASTRVSRDGRQFGSLAAFPEVERLLAPREVTDARALEQQEAQTLRLELDRCRSLAPHELFNVAPTASWNEYRQGFLVLSKRYHPARLPKNAHPDLLHARMEIFQFLSGEMAKLEKRLQGSGPAGAMGTPPLGSPLMGRPLPPERESILELSRIDDMKMRAVIQVPEGSYSLFTSHRVVNLSAGGMFLESFTGVRLGMRLDLLLRFLRRPQKEIATRGVVILESTVPTDRQPIGVGVKLDGLTDSDRSYLKEYVQWAQKPPQERARAT